MAYNDRLFNPGAQAGTPGMKIDTYGPTADSLATVETDGYFDSIAGLFRTGDVLWVRSTHATLGGLRAYFVTKTATDVALTPLPDVMVPMTIVDISSAASAWARCPVEGLVSLITTIIATAITTDDAVLDSQINTVSITGGEITIATAGSAAGTIDSAVPTALNAVSVGDKLETATDGGSTVASRCQVMWHITPIP